MKIKDTESTYMVASKTAQLMGDIVGSPALGTRIVNSLLLTDENPTERNIQCRLREALNGGYLQVKGLGPKGLKRLQSALLLGKSLYLDVPAAGTLVDSPAVAARAFSEMAWEPVEQFAVLALDLKLRLLSMRVISIGTVTETYAHPRDIFRWVMQVGGTRCMMAHNHPSGNARPSDEDLVLTQQLVAAGNLLDIPVLDHLVVAGGEYVSIRETTSLWAQSD